MSTRGSLASLELMSFQTLLAMLVLQSRFLIFDQGPLILRMDYAFGAEARASNLHDVSSLGSSSDVL